MLFNSFAFLIFFPAVCLIYYLLPERYRWLFLLTASYYFYMNWNPVYALLIFASTFVTWGCAAEIENFRKKKQRGGVLPERFLLAICLIVNFGILFLFKYANFINESVFGVLEMLGVRMEVPRFTLLLPVGISFYTFQAVGYTIDVYRQTLPAERHLGIYALFVSFFPQLVAGPIERARNLLPQFKEHHRFDPDMAAAGMRQMLWGYFMKVVVSDRLAIYVNAVYNNAPHHNGSSLILATVFFAFQIYCDFGGYSNIAIGAAKVMGFRLMTNFHQPYASRSIAEFWHRWHISLSTWFKDYLYIPLGGNRRSPCRNAFNVMTTFLVSGLWHGADWTFVIWGGLNGAFQVAGKTAEPMRKRCRSLLRISDDAAFLKLFNTTVTFLLICLAWIFFRANTVSDAFLILSRLHAFGPLYTQSSVTLVYSFLFLAILLFFDAFKEHRGRYPWLESPRSSVRMAAYVMLTLTILAFGVFDGGQFIYFQF